LKFAYDRVEVLVSAKTLKSEHNFARMTKTTLKLLL